jgi:CubicO group peptidase (beta-lactamase class C family)
MTATLPAIDRAGAAEQVRRSMARWQVPGAALGLYRDGQVETFGFGVASLETGQPVRPDTVFQAGSISKVFTATLLMRLADGGQVELDAPVGRYLPELKLADPSALHTITLRHLLSHQAGFYGDRFLDYGHGEDAISKALAEFDTLRQITRPGEVWAYCNTGFQLVGGVIERVLGQPFETAMRERVLQPLGLDRSFYFAHEAITYPVTVGHNPVSGGPPQVARLWARHRARSPQGGLLSSAGDLLRFAAFHMGDGSAGDERVLSSASLAEMQKPQVAAGNFADWYGLGWSLRRFGEEMVVGHGGSTNGFRARLAMVPSRRFALAILTNSDSGVPVLEHVESWALKRYAGLERRQPPVVTLPKAALERLAGRYTDPQNITRVSVHEGGLRLDVTRKSAWTNEESTDEPLFASPLSETRFLVTTEGESAGEDIDFITGDGGVIRFLRLHGRLADRV